MIVFSSLIVTDEPAAEPVVKADVKTQLRLDGTDNDTMIDSLIIVARQTVEAILKKKLITTGVRAGYDILPALISLPLAPVLSITSVTYLDDDGDTQTLSSSLYNTDLESEPARIAIAESASYPTPANRPGAVKVNYTVGYGASASDVPQAIKQAIIEIVIDLFEHPEMSAEIILHNNKTAMLILNSYRNCATVM